MSAKRWTILFLTAALAVLALFAGIMYLLDPMIHYGPESWPLTSYEYAEMYANPGIARHYSYDSVMVGTSMIENTDADLCEELFSCRMVRLPYSGGTTYNMKTILDLCFQSGNAIKTVYWELDEFQLSGSPTDPRYPLPGYLYRTDHREDAKYLLNLDLFYHYAVKDIYNTLRGKIQPIERRGVALKGSFGAKALLAGYNRPAVRGSSSVFVGSRLQEKVDANLANIFSLTDANPETSFVFFFPPFSVLYWDRELRQGTFDSTMDSLEYAMERLLTRDNVSVFFFQNFEEIITDLDNYKDYSHYGSWINDKLTEYISAGTGQVTADSYREEVESLRSFVKNYDFEPLFS